MKIILCEQGLCTSHLFGIINVDFDATGQVLIIHSAFVKYLKRKWEQNEAVHRLFI
jgi:hypothetical protein